MSEAQTFMLYFRVQEEQLSKIDLNAKLIEIANGILNSVEGSQSIKLSDKNENLFIFWNKNKKTLIAHSYSDGLVTVDIQSHLVNNALQNGHTNGNSDEATGEFEETRYFEEVISNALSVDDMHSLLVPIKRGGKVWQYVASSDKRLIETDYDKLVFHKKSKYQTIDILHSKSCGNCLLLDGDLMIGDSDLIYTLTLTGINRGVDYKDKEVLILGGGDGGTLYELLRLERKPKFVWMAEIDEEVVKACRDHLRDVCFDALDNYEGPNHKILFEDCLETLRRFDRENHKIDFVINDLTEYPVNKEVTGYNYDFGTCFAMMELSLKILKPNGRLFARGNCIGATDYFAEWEADVRKLGATFKRIEVFVPSYLEQYYVLYEIIPKQE